MHDCCPHIARIVHIVLELIILYIRNIYQYQYTSVLLDGKKVTYMITWETPQCHTA